MGSINFSNTMGTRFLLPDKSITSFVLSLTNDAGQVLNMNGVDWYLTFQIDIDFWDNLSDNSFRSIVEQYSNL